jgi:hypothetical protein
MTEKTLPIISRRDRNINISVFKKTKDDGKDYYSVCLQRSYKKQGEEEWTRETINLFPDDLLQLENLARCVYTDIISYVQKQKKQTTEFPSQPLDDDIPF